MAASLAKTDPAGPPKPKSRLLLMKERLKSQRQKQIQSLDKPNLLKESSTITTSNANVKASSTGVSEAAVPTARSAAAAVAAVSTTAAVSASPVRGRRFQRLKADEALSSRSKSHGRSEVVHENAAGCMKRSISASKFQEIKLERSLPTLEPVQPKQPSAPSAEVEESGRGGAETDGKLCRKETLLGRSQSFLARLRNRGQTQKEKSSLTSLVKASTELGKVSTEPVATGSGGSIDTGHDNASANHLNNNASHLFSQSVNNATNDTLNFSTGRLQQQQFLDKDASRLTKHLASQPSTEDAKTRAISKQGILKLHSIFGADVKPVTKVSQGLIASADTAMRISLMNTNAPNEHVQSRLLNPKGCQTIAATGYRESQSHSSTDKDTVDIHDTDHSFYQCNMKSQSGLDYREFASVCNNQGLQSDDCPSMAAGRLELINSEKHSIPRDICSCRCPDLNRKPVAGNLVSTSNSPCCDGLNSMCTMNAVGCKSQQHRVQQDSVPVRAVPSTHSRLSDIPEELTPCQVRSHGSVDIANAATDINKNVSKANRNMPFEGSSASSPLLANLPRRYCKFLFVSSNKFSNNV